ncbi:methyl-accepting chemotaxis protein [Rhizobium sp. BIGb0125]|jgi:methyl-accepting chemotaxis protein|uniref:methyl-accepting chemotaxis protein n=1 Tax=Rhizobium sp. BIGb0125 TaxID=2940618 RepID=UPI00216A038E|nr:PAS domain-containing methyl-accepting chemotaxis protein [Rhizobium sp. BIGb0125]MCS4245382.1 methyl-accepting chemotaxis protein [Rhizobium sp. BIGb0125]
MFGLHKVSDARNIVDAISKSQAVIEFTPNGVILNANENFCKALGYDLSEIVGKHHRMFCEPDYSASAEYTQFWQNLAAGKHDTKEYKRIRKDGREIWIQASYNPVFRSGKVYKVIKLATDITAVKQKAVEDASKLNALSKSQAVIEFTSTGEILTANENFCKTLGYDLSEIVGKHHRLFCEPNYAATSDYAQFWQRLSQGEFIADEFVRFGKGGKEVWIQAAYNPIFNDKGTVVKVVKFATDVTPRMSAITALGDGLRALADGELSQNLDTAFVPSMERVRHDFNEVIAKLRNTMQTVAHNATTIAAGSSEIRTAADQLAQRTEQQAASLEQTAAALEEITTTVKDSSLRADDAGRLVTSTKNNAERSGAIVDKAIGAMDEISRSSKEITNIIGVIDDIAFQTNLLALNAGVEAARAGEAGKGFAVVAQEVRELAQRSASAAKEIKNLINTSGDHVANGVELVGQTGGVLREIANQVDQIHVNVSAIVEAAREQANGLAEINQAVNMMDQATQKNAAMVEETTAASHGLARESEILRELLTQFRIGNAQAQAYEAPTPHAVVSRHQQVASPVHKMVASLRHATSAMPAERADQWTEF